MFCDYFENLLDFFSRFKVVQVVFLVVVWFHSQKKSKIVVQ